MRVSPTLGPDDLLLESGKKRAGAEHEIDVGGTAATECLPLDRTDEIDRNFIALRGFALLWRIGPIAVGEVLDRRVHVLFGNIGDEPFDFDVIEGADLDRR